MKVPPATARIRGTRVLPSVALLGTTGQCVAGGGGGGGREGNGGKPVACLATEKKWRCVFVLFEVDCVNQSSIAPPPRPGGPRIRDRDDGVDYKLVSGPGPHSSASIIIAMTQSKSRVSHKSTNTIEMMLRMARDADPMGH